MRSLLTIIGLVASISSPQAGPATCALSAAETAWLQQAIDGWETVERELLRLEARPLPLIVLIGDECAYDLLAGGEPLADRRAVATTLSFAGQPLQLFGAPHEGAVQLPNGNQVPARGMAFASLYGDDRRPFFVLALPDVFRLEPQAAADPDLERVLLGVISHEMVHTLQLADAAARVAALQERHPGLPRSVGDDIIEERFGDDAAFRAAFEAERELLYRAVKARGDERVGHIEEALAMIDSRRARFFFGDDAPYRELEELFLNMEGVAEWAKLQLELAQPDGRWESLEEALDDADDPRNSWSQAEGLALVLLLEELTDDWRERMLGEEVASPVELLRASIAGDEARGRGPAGVIGRPPSGDRSTAHARRSAHGRKHPAGRQEPRSYSRYDALAPS